MSNNTLGFILQKRKRPANCDGCSPVPAPVLTRVNLKALVRDNGNILLPDIEDYFLINDTVYIECNYELHATPDYSTGPIISSFYDAKSPDVEVNIPEGTWYIRYRCRYRTGTANGPWGEWMVGQEYNELGGTQYSLVTPATPILMPKPFPALKTYGVLMVLPPVNQFTIAGGYSVPDETRITAFVFYGDTLAAADPNSALLIQADFFLELQQTAATPHLFDISVLENGTPGSYRTVRVFYYAYQIKDGTTIYLDTQDASFEYDAISDQVSHVFRPPVIDPLNIPRATSAQPETVTLPAVSEFLFQPASSNVGFDVEEIRYEIIDVDGNVGVISGALDPLTTKDVTVPADTSYNVRYRLYQENTTDNIAVQSEWAQQDTIVNVFVQYLPSEPTVENKTMRLPPLSEFTIGASSSPGTYTIEARLFDVPVTSGTPLSILQLTTTEQFVDLTPYTYLVVVYNVVYTYDAGGTNVVAASAYTIPVDVVLTLTSIAPATKTDFDTITFRPLSEFVYSNSTDPGVVIQYELNSVTGFIGSSPTVLDVAPDTTHFIRYRNFLQTASTLFYSDWVVQAEIDLPPEITSVSPGAVVTDSTITLPQLSDFTVTAPRTGVFDLKIYVSYYDMGALQVYGQSDVITAASGSIQRNFPEGSYTASYTAQYTYDGGATPCSGGR